MVPQKKKGVSAFIKMIKAIENGEASNKNTENSVRLKPKMEELFQVYHFATKYGRRRIIYLRDQCNEIDSC